MSSKDPSERIWRLMSEIETAMIVTHADAQGDIRARPMVARPEIDDNAIYFFTDAGAPKDQEIERDSHVCLTFSDVKGNRYVSLTGTADVVADRGLAARLWKAADKAFWKNAEDPSIRILRVTPERGEFWEGAGFVSSLVSMIAAGATGNRPKLGESAKVQM